MIKQEELQNNRIDYQFGDKKVVVVESHNYVLPVWAEYCSKLKKEYRLITLDYHMDTRPIFSQCAYQACNGDMAKVNEYTVQRKIYDNYIKHKYDTNKIEELSFKSLSTDFTMKAYDSFISKFPQSKYTVQANALVKPINQNEWHWKSNGLKGYVKSTTETSSKEGSKNNSNSTDIITQYNELGEVILEQTTTGKDVKITQILYHPDFSLSAIIESNGRKRYDYKNGQLNKITFINSRKKESPIATFKYDNGGRLIERTDYITGVKGSTITHYTYNANDSIISSKKYKSTTPKNTTIQQYIDGKVVSSTETIGKQTTQKRYAYNDKGDLIKITTTKNNKDTENITYEYLYDETGNWTKQSMFINGTLNIVRQRVIEYFYK